MEMAHLDVVVLPGTIMTLDDVFAALIRENLPADATVSRSVFWQLLCRVESDRVGRDDGGVYIDIARCRIRLAGV